jgi:hypothetical protein
VASPVGREGVALFRRESDFVITEGGTWDDGGNAGIEKAATAKGGSKGLAAEAAPIATISRCVDPCRV